MALDLVLLERGVRRTYELARLRDALVGGLPLAVLAGVAVWLGPQRWFVGAVGVALVVAVVGYFWHGLGAAKAVLPGVGAGLVPLVLTHVANGFGPGCTAHGCGTYCMEACIAGGGLASLALLRFAHRAEHPPSAWGYGASLAWLTGALGCSCVGYTGVLALGGVLVGLSLPSLVTWARARA